MGQYRQWLHYREVDQQLQAKLIQLEHELSVLQEQAGLLEDSAPYTDNVIIAALSHYLLPRNQPSQTATPSRERGASLGPQQTEQQTVSQALHAWGRLPNFDSENTSASIPDIDRQPTNPEIDLLPADMAAFLKSYTTSASPPSTSSWWPPHTPTSTNGNQQVEVIDPQSARTNQLVQRWLERWHRRPKASTITPLPYTEYHDALLDQEYHQQHITDPAKNAVPDIHQIFAQIDTKTVEAFYRIYHSWLSQRQIGTLTISIAVKRQELASNTELMQRTQPSALALATLTRLQSSGVTDVDVLDRMLERGEDWLDHTMQLLEYCEQMDVIQSDYTGWCENALDGAYEWIASMKETSEAPGETSSAMSAEIEPYDATIEERFLSKLMSEDEETTKIPVVEITRKITRPLSHKEEALKDPAVDSTRKITRPLSQNEVTLPVRKITSPLPSEEPGDTDESQIATQTVPEDAITSLTEEPAVGAASTTEEESPAIPDAATISSPGEAAPIISESTSSEETSTATIAEADDSVDQVVSEPTPALMSGETVADTQIEDDITDQAVQPATTLEVSSEALSSTSVSPTETPHEATSETGHPETSAEAQSEVAHIQPMAAAQAQSELTEAREGAQADTEPEEKSAQAQPRVDQSDIATDTQTITEHEAAVESDAQHDLSALSTIKDVGATHPQEDTEEAAPEAGTPLVEDQVSKDEMPAVREPGESGATSSAALEETTPTAQPVGPAPTQLQVQEKPRRWYSFFWRLIAKLWKRQG